MTALLVSALLAGTGPGPCGADVLIPIKQEVQLGRIARGDMASLAYDDGNAESVCYWFVPNMNVPFVRIDLTFGPTVSSPSALGTIVKAKWANAGAYRLELWQWDYRTPAWVVTMPRTPLTGEFVLFTGEATGDLSRFVDPATASTRARMGVWRAGPSTVLRPCIDFELANQVVSG